MISFGIFCCVNIIFFALSVFRVQTALFSSLRWEKDMSQLGLLLSQGLYKAWSGHLSHM